MVAFLDGGSGGIGSAQQLYWDGSKMAEYQSSGRAVADITVIYNNAVETPSETEKPVEEDYKAKYEALLGKYNDLQKTNQENLQTATDLKKDYEARIAAAISALNGGSK